MPKAVLIQTEEVKVIKKTFLAVAVGAALGSVGANAAPTFTFDVNDWTTEGAMDVTDFAVPDIGVTLGTEYTPNDVIKFTFSQTLTVTTNRQSW